MAVSAVVALLSTGSVALTGGAFILGSAISHFLVSTAMGAALNALTPKAKVGGAGGYSIQGTSGSALDHQIIYGETRVGSLRLYDCTTGNNNTNLHRILAFAGHEIDSYRQIYLNDEVVTLDASGNVTFPLRYINFVRIRQYLGTESQVADPLLITETALVANGKWTVNHRLQGIAYLYVRFIYNANAFPNGLPAVSAVIRGKKVLNPDTNVTAWSDNPALCIRDYLTAPYGLSQPANRIDDGLVNAAVAICNQTVEGEKRYTCNGAFITGAAPSTILDDLLTSMGGLLWYGQGKWRMKAASWTEPLISFNEDDLRSGISLSTRHSRRDNFNSVKGTFKGPESDYQPADYPEVTEASYLTADNGLINVLDFSLPFTSSSKTAQRIARIALNRNREQLTFSASFGMRAFQVQVGDFVKISNERFGWVDKAFEVTEWTFGLTDALDIQTRMTLREISESVFADVDGQEFENNNTTLPNPFTPSPVGTPTVTEQLYATRDGLGARVLLDIQWQPSEDAFLDRYVVQVRRIADLEGTPISSEFISLPETTQTSIEFRDVETGTWEVRVKYINLLGVSSEYSTATKTIFGLTALPEQLEGLTLQSAGGLAVLKWQRSVDLDVRLGGNIVIRHSEAEIPTWQNSYSMDRVGGNESIAVVPLKTGTYLVRAEDSGGRYGPVSSVETKGIQVIPFTSVGVLQEET
jgi:predicted phage tail protein